MSVLDGPRTERRHVMHGGGAYRAAYEYSELRLNDAGLMPKREVTYLPPCRPTKIICIYLNYLSRLYEFTAANKPPATPTYFQKPVTAINAHYGESMRPAWYQYLNYEGEVAAVIGEVGCNIAVDQVWEHLAGFAAANDVGLHDMGDTDSGSMLRVKGGDGFCPLGPGIVSGIDIRRQTLRTYRNGNLVQEGDVAEMPFGIDCIIADSARHITARRCGDHRHAG